MFERAEQAARQGLYESAVNSWLAILAIDPVHVPALQAMGQQALLRRDFIRAQHCFEQLTQVDAQSAKPWVHLAMLFRANGNAVKQEEALFQALRVNPHEMMALLMRGNLFERQGRSHEAVSNYQGAMAVAPQREKMIPDLCIALDKAEKFCGRYQQQSSDAIDQLVAQNGSDLAGADLDRFRLSLDIMFGRKKRFESQPMGYFFPNLPATEFFEGAQFPWLAGLEAVTEKIRDEFLAVLHKEDGFTPYLTYSQDQPLNQWVELNNSPRWSAFHLLKDGLPVVGNADQCPQTMSALARTPQPEQPGRTPVAMFSLLKPHTRIPPHVGVTNARLVVHLPLIVPPGCSFRVGNSTRRWTPGQAWVFDDTIEHEARNDSNQLRVVLIFDIWHPALTAVERRMITLMTQAQNQFLGDAGGQDL